jgi:hypothetical protein
VGLLGWGGVVVLVEGVGKRGAKRWWRLGVVVAM